MNYYFYIRWWWFERLMYNPYYLNMFLNSLKRNYPFESEREVLYHLN